jgi:hypothetical protein
VHHGAHFGELIMALLEDIPLTSSQYALTYDPKPIYEGGPEGRRATMHFLTGINTVSTFVQFIKGTVETINGGLRVVPLLYPDDHELQLISYMVEYFGTPTGTAPLVGESIYTPLFSHARISCEFRTLPFDLADAAYYSISTDTGAVIETIPDSALVFPGGERTTGDYGLPIPITGLVITTYMSPTPVSYTLASLTGKVNSSTAFGFPAGTLRFNGVKSDFARGLYSRTLVKSFSLAFREPGWNYVMKRNGTWDIPLYPGNGNPKYLSADLNILAQA